ncbi:hypothetical protein M5689_015017 [Euphorbia peplus]|nr:hypothetical protein M5689_015017 [Euphorbia peplus]
MPIDNDVQTDTHGILDISNPSIPVSTTGIDQDTTSVERNTSTSSNPSTCTHVIPARRSHRTKTAPQYLKDFNKTVTNTISHPLESVLSYDRLSSKQKSYIMAIDIVPEPKTFQQAQQHQC